MLVSLGYLQVKVKILSKALKYLEQMFKNLENLDLNPNVQTTFARN
jgi:hypothetical protein